MKYSKNIFFILSLKMNIKIRTHRRVQATRVPSSLIAPTLGLCVTNRSRYDKELLSRKSHNESTFSMYSGVFKECNLMPPGGLTEIFQLILSSTSECFIPFKLTTEGFPILGQ